MSAPRQGDVIRLLNAGDADLLLRDDGRAGG
jgi:hypothetical protein